MTRWPRRFDPARLCMLMLAAAVVCSPGWSPPGDERRATDAIPAGTRILAPGFETGLVRATPSVAIANEADRFFDRRSYPALAIVSLAGLLGVLALTPVAFGGRRARFRTGRLSFPFGSRAPPELLLT
ncbi:MAG: hypothetical protein ACRDJL_11985 [Actinomycetota bacterium]